LSSRLVGRAGRHRHGDHRAGGVVAEAPPAGFSAPLGVVLGVPAVLLGLVLVVAAQLAVAVFENTNATLEMLAIERGRLSF
jgi:hypothetical protein